MKEYAEIQSSPNYQYTAAPLEVIYIYIYIFYFVIFEKYI